MSIKQQILAANDLRLEKLEIPEWNVNLWVRAWDGSARSRHEDRARALSKGASTRFLREHIVAISVCDEEGRLVFDEDKDLEALSKKSSAILDRIVAAALKVNAITADDLNDLKKS
ncbi:hypothetical protein [Anatilimnocola floriformis]|uniref:hypothetical protein n=1 Tax=Anatilimnocola floriformis TaxID=2948575 RepID=UPI0020C50F6F|nr:hypothetical protein [Anatilimnocola floriformis]